jgi:hypothetical protein
MIRCVFLKTEMPSTAMIVVAVSLEDVSQMSVVDDDHVVETLSSNRADQAFHVRVGVSRRLHHGRAVRHKRFESRIRSNRCTGASSN